MSKSENIIGMSDLLDEVNHDLDDFRKKHASDYSLKNITMWWELEKERLLIRHKEARVARKHFPRRRAWTLVVGSFAMFAAGVLLTLTVR